MTLQIVLVFTLTGPKTFTRGCVNVFDIYLHWPRVGVKNTYIHCNRISVHVKFFDVYDLHLHGIYMPYIQLLTLRPTRLVWTSVGWFSFIASPVLNENRLVRIDHEDRHETRIEGSH